MLLKFSWLQPPLSIPPLPNPSIIIYIPQGQLFSIKFVNVCIHTHTHTCMYDLGTKCFIQLILIHLLNKVNKMGKSISICLHAWRSASAVIYKSHEVQTQAPVVASFSSRGPSPGSQHLLKVFVSYVHTYIVFTYINSKYSSIFIFWNKNHLIRWLKPYICAMWTIHSLILQHPVLTFWRPTLFWSHSLGWQVTPNSPNLHSCLALPCHVHTLPA